MYSLTDTFGQDRIKENMRTVVRKNGGNRMARYMLKYVVTGTSDVPFSEMVADYDPLLLGEMSLVLSNLLGGTCCVEVEEIELIAAEELDEV